MCIRDRYKTYARYVSTMEAERDEINNQIVIAERSLDAGKPDMSLSLIHIFLPEVLPILREGRSRPMFPYWSLGFLEPSLLQFSLRKANGERRVLPIKNKLR